MGESEKIMSDEELSVLLEKANTLAEALDPMSMTEPHE